MTAALAAVPHVAYQLAALVRLRALLTAAAGAAPPDRDAVDQLERGDGLAFVEACRRMQVDARVRDALLMIAAPHLDDSIRDAIAASWKQPGRRHVDAALLARMLAQSPADALAIGAAFHDEGPFHRAGLVESQPIALGHSASPLELELVPTPRLLGLLAGRVELDGRLRRFTSTVAARAGAAVGVVSPARLTELVGLIAAARSALRRRRGAHVLISGAPGVGKLRLATSLAEQLGARVVLTVEAAYLPTDPTRLARILEALALEAEMLGGVLLLRRVDNLIDGARLAAIVGHALAGLGGDVWLTSDADPAREDLPHLAELATMLVALPVPETSLRRDAWQAELADAGLTVADDLVKVLASEYPLPRTVIETVVALVATDRGATPEAIAAQLPRIAESQMRGQLARFAKRTRNRARLGDLVLGDNTREQVLEVLEAVRRRTLVMDRWGLTERHATGRGIVAMFNGPPGTGKTLAASVIANELELPLFRIDVSNIVDRFVGETEKNLSRMFEEAVACRAALLFDEADSLFGKRVEAKDATDRFANMQVNLLLNLIEDYDGFVVLTTNLKGALDTAFMRRIAYKVFFEMPEHDERVALWAYHLPPSIPQASDVSLDDLAEEFDTVAGGDIKNAVLRAALAAGGERPVTQEQLRRSMINELRANGSVIADKR